MAERTGKFLLDQRPNNITLQSMRGLYDPALSSDCRCGRECADCQFSNYCGEVKPWTALSSPNNWDDDLLTQDELPDGDTQDPNNVFVSLEELAACDMSGRPYYLYDDEELEVGLSDAIAYAELRDQMEAEEFDLDFDVELEEWNDSPQDILRDIKDQYSEYFVEEDGLPQQEEQIIERDIPGASFQSSHLLEPMGEDRHWDPRGGRIPRSDRYKEIRKKFGIIRRKHGQTGKITRRRCTQLSPPHTRRMSVLMAENDERYLDRWYQEMDEAWDFGATGRTYEGKFVFEINLETGRVIGAYYA